MPEQDRCHRLQEQVHLAVSQGSPLVIQAGNSKSFLGRTVGAETDVLNVQEHQGIVCYEPTELVITARSGTKLDDVEHMLRANNQMLAFEPPHFDTSATLGGTIACNLSGPRRPYTGAARDFLLGTRILNGKGDILKFGGEVMKNVAGYDVSRLMAGAMGTLGVILEISLKVLPRPELERTLKQQIPIDTALDRLHTWARTPLPISASCYLDDTLYIRLSGTAGAVKAAQAVLGGDTVENPHRFWQQITEHRHRFFQTDQPVWRLSVASNAPPMDLPGKWLYEWGGALRWLIADLPAKTVQQAAADTGGHVTWYRNHNANCNEVFHPLSRGLLALHQRLKHAMDPHGILNPGRIYADL